MRITIYNVQCFQWLIQDFPEGEIILAIFSRKLHEIEKKNWTGGVSSAPPDSPMQTINNFKLLPERIALSPLVLSWREFSGTYIPTQQLKSATLFLKI